MLDSHLAKTKTFFTVLVLIWMVVIVALTQSQILERGVASAERESEYLRYAYEFNQGTNNNGLVASVIQTLNNSSQTNIASADGTESAIPVLLYHGIVSHPDRFSLTPEAFKEQMFTLKRAGYETIKMADFIAFMQGQKELPAKSFLLVFDDGRTDSYKGADAVLKALNWSAVMFVATGQSIPASGPEDPYYLNKDQLKEMTDSGHWELDSHAIQELGGGIPLDSTGAVGNLLSNKMWLDDEKMIETDAEYEARIQNEFATSKQTLESLTGQPVNAFAYPFGDYGDQSINANDIAEGVIREIVSANYTVAFQQTWDRDNLFTENYPGHEADFYRLRRVEPDPLWSGATLVDFLAKAAPKNLPYTDPITVNNGWKNPWGSLSFDDNGLHLQTATDTTGSFAFLDGSRLWTDYFYTANVTRELGGYVTLFARYQDDDNYVSCTFGDKLVKIDEKVGGKLTTLVEDQNPIKPPADGAYYSIYVDGTEAKCYEGGAVAVISFNFDSKLDSGGIGLRIWDETPNNGSVRVSQIQAVSSEEAYNLRTALPLYAH